MELGDNGIVMTSIGVSQSARLVMCSSLVSIATLVIGLPALHPPAIAEPLSATKIQFTLDHSLLAQANQQTQAEPVPNVADIPNEPAAQGEPEREIEFTSPTFSIGVQGEGVQEEGTQGESTQTDSAVEGPPAQGTASQQPLEAGAQQDATAADSAASEADNEALAAQHDWVEFSVEDSDEAIARYGCDDLYCINALREQRGLPPLQLVWDEQQADTQRQ